MAAYTSSVDGGDWSLAATWGGAGPPGDGDTATVATNVNITTSVTVGTSGASATVAVTINSGKTLAVKAGGTLIQRGDVSLAGGTLSLEAGSTHRFDPPTGSTYRVLFASGTATCNYLGTSGSRCTASTTARGGGAGYYAANFTGNQGVKTCQYSDFTTIGSGANLGPNYYMLSGPNTVTYDHNTFTSCGTVKIAVGGLTNATFTYTDNVHTTPTTTPFSLACSANNATGSRTVARNTFMVAGTTRPSFFGPLDLVCDDNYFDDYYQVSSTTGLNSFASFKGNFIQALAISGGTSIPLDGVLTTECYFFGGPGGTNPHFCQFPQFRDGTVDLCIVEHGGANTDGDIFYPGLPSADRHSTLTRVIKLPNATGGSSGTLFSWLGNAHAFLDKCEHCTFHLGGAVDSSGGRLGETYNLGSAPAMVSGLFGTFKGNLCWDTSNQGGFKVTSLNPVGSTGTATDSYLSANCDYNGGYNFAAGTNGNGYNYLSFSSGSPGVHDVSGNPQFVDSTRCLAKWDLSKGGPGTAAAALVRLQANPLLCRTDLMPWIRAGFVPQAAIYKNASYPGDALMADLGAVPVVLAPTLTAGAATFVGSGPTGITLSATNATLGTTPYTYQWQRMIHGGTTWVGMSDGGGVTGSATLSLFDGSAAPGTLYDYRLKYTDAASTSVFSNAVPAAGAQVYPGGPIGGGSIGSQASDFDGGF